MDFASVLRKFEKSFGNKLIVVASIIVGALVLALVWDVCFWPTDTEVYYLPASQNLFSFKYISEIHQALDSERVKWLHGKEVFVFTIAVFQKILGDLVSLRPIMVLGVLLHVISAVLVFINFKRLWGKTVACVAYVLFVGCLWPYVYVLMGKHQTQGLTFFLLSVFFILQNGEGKRVFLNIFLAGLSMGASFFSSTVSIMYFPYLLLIGLWKFKSFISTKAGIRRFSVWPSACAGGAAFAVGFLLILAWVTYPDVITNTKSYFDYVGISQNYNHFFYNQVVLHQWIPDLDPQTTRGGWVWTFKYLFLVTPVILVLSLTASLYLLREAVRNKSWIHAAVVCVCFSTPMLIEFKRIAQYGANYFSVLLGMIVLIAYALAHFFHSLRWKKATQQMKSRWINIAVMVLAAHVIYNVYVFATDVLLPRMGTAYLARTLKALNVRHLDTYKLHPLRPNVVDVLPPQILKQIQWTPIENILQAKSDYVLVAPISKDNIYLATKDYTDFDLDPFLNAMVRRGDLKKYAAASFPTIGSSLIWSQEEEILAYRYLLLNQFPGAGDKSKIWLLNRTKILDDQPNVIPSKDDAFIFQNNVRNIGTKSLVYMFKGYQSKAVPGTELLGIAARVYKVGNPQDQLVAFLYRVDDTQPLWVPFDRAFRSKPIAAAAITDNPQGQVIRFEFERPHTLTDQPFFVAIYRTGGASDGDYYRVYESFIGRIEDQKNLKNRPLQ